MSELFEVVDAADRRLALSASGLLSELNQAGVLTAADVHVAIRVGRLTGESDERVLLAAALAVRAVRLGSVCADLVAVADAAPDLPWPSYGDWTAAVTESPLLTAGVLRWEFDLLYLDRYGHQEVALCRDLESRIAQPTPVVDEPRLERGLPRVFPGETYGEQREASRRAAVGVDHRADRWSRHGQDHHRGRSAGAAGRAGSRGRCAPASDRAHGADRQGGRAAAGGGGA
jgi:exodeoxyribonuclease V alpha subunit